MTLRAGSLSEVAGLRAGRPPWLATALWSPHIACRGCSSVNRHAGIACGVPNAFRAGAALRHGVSRRTPTGLLAALAERGHAEVRGGTGNPVVILAARDAPNPYVDLLASALEAAGLRVVCLYPYWRLLRQLRDMGRPRAVHVQWLSWLFERGSAFRCAVRACLWLGQLAALRLRGTAIVWTVHNLLSHDRRHPKTERLVRMVLARVCTAIVVHCPRGEESVRRFLKLSPRAPVRVVLHGPYPGSVPERPSRPASAPLTFLHVGLIRDYKGVPELLGAFTRLPEDPPSRLVIAGEVASTRLGHLIEDAARRDDRIRLALRRLSGEALEAELAAADAVVTPYRDILTSGTVLLAMSRGLPVVAPRLGCIPDEVGEEGGFLYDPLDPEGLYNALRRAQRERHRLPEMGRANAARMARRDWSAIARQLRDAYGPVA